MKSRSTRRGHAHGPPSLPAPEALLTAADLVDIYRTKRLVPKAKARRGVPRTDLRRITTNQQAVLDALTDESQSAAEIGRAADLTNSQAGSALRALAQKGLAVRDNQTSRWTRT